MVSSMESVFNRRFDLFVDVFRNLDGIRSHNAPDLTVLTSISKLTWRMTSDFYSFVSWCAREKFCSFFPSHLPHTTFCERKLSFFAEVGSDSKYATLSFRLLLDEVQLDCQVPLQDFGPSPNTLFGQRFTPFAIMQLQSARVSFDVFIDGQSELDLVCEKSHLLDNRKVQLGSGTKNLFTTILQPRESTGNNFPLMSEAHIMMRKDEVPVVTLVLMHSRVLSLYDWLNDAKSFIMLSTDFVPKYRDDPVRYVANGGVLARMGSAPLEQQQTVALKITIRDSDLYFLENPNLDNSFAVVATTNAVLNLNDTGNMISANLEIQNMAVAWCCMKDEKRTLNQCSNEFSIAVSMAMTDPVTPATEAPRGLPSLAIKRHSLEIDINGMIGRLSYKDMRVLRATADGFIKNFYENCSKTMVPTIGTPPSPKSIEIGRVLLKTARADLWLLDDFQGSSIPLLRVSLSNLSIDRQSEDRLVSNFALSADYFNQRVFGWEPMVEKWSVLRFLMVRKDNTQNVDLVAESRSTLDINITQQLMQQAVQFASRWPAIRASFERDDFRNSCARSRSDHLPYLFKNETGCEVMFSTAVEDIQLARNQQRRATVRWITVPKDKEHTFEFPARLLLYSHSEREPPRQVIVKVNGWDEISPVHVDACGTYFRLVKAVKKGMPMARVVIRVTMEKDGKKVVAVRSSIDIHNQLPHQLAVFSAEDGKVCSILKVDRLELMLVEPSQSRPVPLQFAHCQFMVRPEGCQVHEKAEIIWKNVRVAGETLNKTEYLESSKSYYNYWMCTSVRREHYPDHEGLPGHSIYVVAPLTIQNLLPIDVEIHILDHVFPVAAGKLHMISIVSPEITFGSL
ncbi:hypothetical protein NECAME_14247 [Necator americanus]|uniref:Vacuolar protein sorting-associated protein 13 VPS13 adaptor binding domain-containing protein n=1 Tax=Necator americanus TaxID=51031 RepID=W2SNZ3_NECAM|nr:hypothetical protein NECAME_14247 [Necator americanus]ETN71355.1 hypothetical protein NECAME_14247 [Necator americanus]